MSQHRILIKMMNAMLVGSSFDFDGFDTFIAEVKGETGAAKDGDCSDSASGGEEATH